MRIWKREAVVPAGPEPLGSTWTLDHIGIGRDPSGQSPLPFGFAFENPRTFEPLSAADTTATDGRLLARRVFQNSSLLIAKLQTADKEETGSATVPASEARARWIGVLSCAACHVGRVMVWTDEAVAGMPNTEIEAQHYSKLLMLTPRRWSSPASIPRR